MCTLTDNGIGYEASKAIRERQQTQHTGFSTTAAEERVTLLNQSLKRPIKLEREDVLDNGEVVGYRVCVVFPPELGQSA